MIARYAVTVAPWQGEATANLVRNIFPSKNTTLGIGG